MLYIMLCIALAFALEWKFNEINSTDVCVRRNARNDIVVIFVFSQWIVFARFSDGAFENISSDVVS